MSEVNEAVNEMNDVVFVQGQGTNESIAGEAFAESTDNRTEEPEQPARKVKQKKTAPPAEAHVYLPTQVYEFDPEELRIDQSTNGRFAQLSPNDPDVKELAQSIRVRGQLVPGLVTVRLDGTKDLTAGNRRIIAIGIVNEERKPKDRLKFKALVEMEQENNGVQPTLDNAIENFHRKDLKAIDKMKIVNMLYDDHKLSVQDIHERLVIPKPLISVYRKVWAVPDPVKKLIASDWLPMKGVYELAVVDAANIEAHVEKLIARAGGKSVTVDACIEYVRQLREKLAAESGGKKRKGKTKSTGKTRQRTTAQLLKCFDGWTSDVLRPYGDKTLSDKVKLIRGFVKGGSEETFLKGLAAL